jgi:hypothetical protein
MSLFRLSVLVLCFVGVFVPVHGQATQLATQGTGRVGLPVYPTQYSQAEKQEQREKGREIVEKINQTVRSGGRDFTVPPGVYRIPNGVNIGLSQTENGFRLNLQGVEFIKEDCEPLFHLWKARKIEIIGPVILDADPSPCIQGVVSHFQGETGVVMMEVEAGFPLQVPGNKPGNNTENVVKAFSHDGQWLKNPQWNTIRDYRIEDAEHRLVAFRPKVIDGDAAGIFRPGNRLVLGYGGIMFISSESEDVLLQDIDCHHGGSVMWGDGRGEWKVVRVRSVPRPGSCRLTGGHSFQFEMPQGSFLMDGCEFCSNTDDLLDLQMGKLMLCAEQEAADSVIVYNDVPKLGDTLRFYRHDDFSVAADAMVAEVEQLSDQQLEVIQRDLMQRVADKELHCKVREKRSMRRVRIDRAVPGLRGCWVENKSLQLDVTMRNCDWRDCSTRVMIQGCTQALVESNTFTRISGGLVICCDAWWLEGGTGHNITIRDNRFQETSHRKGWASGDAAITIGPNIAMSPNEATQYAFENIEIVGNTIANSSAGGVKVSHAEAIRICDNTIDGLFLDRPPTAAFILSGCHDVSIRKNELTRCPGEVVEQNNCTLVDLPP